MNDNFNYCRLCAEIKTRTELIDPQIDEKSSVFNIESKIYNLFTIKMNKDSELPKTICIVCFEKVLTCYEFKEQIEKAQSTLHDILICKKDIKDDIKDEEIGPGDEYNDNFNDDASMDAKNSDDDVKVEQLGEQEQETEKENNSVGNLKKRKLKPRQRKKSKGVQDRKRRIIPNAVWDKYEWKCYDCDAEISSIKHLRRHYVEIHEKPPVYVCSKCRKVYQQRQFSAFYKHVCRHAQDPVQFRCNDCGKLSNSKGIHEKHLRIHNVDAKYICPECGKCFKSQSYLRKHAFVHLPDEAKPKFSCTKCNKQFLGKTALKYHEAIHAGTRPLIYCEQCAKSFTTKSNLELHIKTQHSEERPYQCDQCPKNFKSLPNLQTHIKVHRGLRPHRCDACGKLFATKATLKRHSSTHSGVLPFECEYCHKRFRIAQFLKIHIRQHTGERPFSCEECNHHFANSSNYIKHMKGRHGILSIAKNPVNCNIKFLVQKIDAVKSE